MTSLTLAVDASNDLMIGPDGGLLLVQDLAAVAQALKQAALTQLGEMVFATDQGVPNFATLWSGSPNLQQYDAALRLALLSVPEVIDIASLAITNSAGVVQYTATVKTLYGTANLNG